MPILQDTTVEAPSPLTQTCNCTGQPLVCSEAHQQALSEADACRSGLVTVAAGLHECRTSLQESQPHTYANLSQAILNAFFQAEKVSQLDLPCVA